MISGVAVALPAMGADLGAGATALSLVETLFLAASVALLLPAGRLADATDKATLYKLGMAAFALSSVAIGLVSSIAARARSATAPWRSASLSSRCSCSRSGAWRSRSSTSRR